MWNAISPIHHCEAHTGSAMQEPVGPRNKEASLSFFLWAPWCLHPLTGKNHKKVSNYRHSLLHDAMYRKIMCVCVWMCVHMRVQAPLAPFKRVGCLTVKWAYYKIVLPTKALLHQESTGRNPWGKCLFYKIKSCYCSVSQTFKGINLLEFQWQEELKSRQNSVVLHQAAEDWNRQTSSLVASIKWSVYALWLNTETVIGIMGNNAEKQ